MTMTYSEAGMTVTGAAEGLRLVAYQDGGGVWTIGYGHTGPEVHQGMTITRDQAKTLLLADLHAAIAVVNRMVHVTLSQNQFDALVDFSFNAGIGAFATSDALTMLNSGDYAGAAAQLRKTRITVKGQPSQGLINRRAAECELILKAA